MDREVMSLRDSLIPKYAELVYNGFWFAPEREALQKLFDLGLSDTFRLFEQEEKSFSWWDYRAGAFHKNQGLSIDLVLLGGGLLGGLRDVSISREYRKNSYDYLIGDWPIIQQESTFWRRSLWDAAGAALDEGCSLAFDSELWCRFFLHAEHYHLECPIGAYRKVPYSTSIKRAAEFARHTESKLQHFRKSAPANVVQRRTHYRIFKWLLRVFGSPVLTPWIGRLFGALDFKYRSIIYEPSSGKWRLESRW